MSDFEVRMALCSHQKLKGRDEAIRLFNEGATPEEILKALLEHIAGEYGCRLETDKKGRVKMVRLEGWPQG